MGRSGQYHQDKTHRFQKFNTLKEAIIHAQQGIKLIDMFISSSLYKDYNRFIKRESSEASSESAREDKQEIRNLKRANLDLQEKLLEQEARCEAMHMLLQTQTKLDNSIKGISYAKAIDNTIQTQHDAHGEMLFTILQKVNMLEDTHKYLGKECLEIKDILIKDDSSPKQEWMDAFRETAMHGVEKVLRHYNLIEEESKNRTKEMVQPEQKDPKPLLQIQTSQTRNSTPTIYELSADLRNNTIDFVTALSINIPSEQSHNCLCTL